MSMAEIFPMLIYLKKGLWFFLVCLALLLAYVLLILITSYFPVNTDFSSENEDGIAIYVLSNGVHTDLVLPSKHALKDWNAFFRETFEKTNVREGKFTAFGWGDKGFYLETPTWADLKFSTAMKAMFFLGESAMHVSFYDTMHEHEYCKKIVLSKVAYMRLCAYIHESFKTANDKFLLIPGASYGHNDVFFEAQGSYSFAYTCNSWTNEGLKKAGVRTSLWTLFDKPILHHCEKISVSQPEKSKENLK